MTPRSRRAISRRPKRGVGFIYLRVLKPAISSGLLTLVTSGKIRLALDFLLSAGQTGLGQALPGLASLCDSPIGVDWHSVDRLGAMRAVSVYVAQTFSLYVSLIDHMRPDWRFLLGVIAGC